MNLFGWLSGNTSAGGSTVPRGGTGSAPLASSVPAPENLRECQNLERLLGALRASGFEACEIIVGIDFTKSNMWTGRNSFNGRCLHEIGEHSNPYMDSLKFIAKRLEVYDDDHMIPCYGFGDVRTARESVFSFYPNNRPANGLESLLERYKEITSTVRMSGPTTFAPLIRQAMRDVYNSGMRFHMLLILADGQISEECKEDTIQAIRQAASFPLSIVMIGVGDGPWGEMEYFDDELPGREWDNFQFFELNKIIAANVYTSEDSQGELFEEQVLAELSDQFKEARELTGNQNAEEAKRIIELISSDQLLDPPEQ